MRKPTKEFLKVYSSFKLSCENYRVPQNHKNRVRRSSKTTFVIKNRAFRVVKDGEHYELLKKLEWAYSTSANRSSESYNADFCFKNSDIVVEDSRGLKEMLSSTILKLYATKIVKLR